jgi:hypothetical protein
MFPSALYGLLGRPWLMAAAILLAVVWVKDRVILWLVQIGWPTVCSGSSAATRSTGQLSGLAGRHERRAGQRTYQHRPEHGERLEDGMLLLGDSGTGKSHLLIGLGQAACEQGRRVRYATTAALVNELAEAADNRQLSRVVGRYGRLDLLLLDELGYVQLDPRGAELLFQIITEREERASIAIGTNLPFNEWGTVFPDPRHVAAIVDRVTFNAHIVETGTQSYWLAASKTSRTRPRRPG